MRPLLDSAGIDALRSALSEYTVDALYDGLPADAGHALRGGDLPRLRRTLAAPGGRTGRLATLVRLFLLGDPVSAPEARQALSPLSLDEAAPLLASSAGEVRARLDLRPFRDDRVGADWWVLSDFGTDVRPGPVAPDHVLGIGAASLSLLAAAVPAPRDARTLDIGTGCGVGALVLGARADSVVATDISTRALTYASTAAALAGQSWDLRAGSLTDPVADDRFDLVLSNPPFVVSPGWGPGDGGFEYRDGGRAGDALVRQLVRSLPGVLAPGGTAQLLANWIVPSDGDWSARVGEWLSGLPVDAWVWQREALDPVDYVTFWLRDAGEDPAGSRWAERFDRWLAWFRTTSARGVGMGLVTLRRTEHAPTAVFEDVRQPLPEYSGAVIAGWLERARWLAAVTDEELLATPLRRDSDLELASSARTADHGWAEPELRLVQRSGLGFEVATDSAVSAVVGGCDGSVPVGVLADLVSTMLDAPGAQVRDALVPVLRDLLQRGFLLPPDPAS